MAFFAQRIVKGVPQLASDNNVMMGDLKTLRGAINRLKKQSNLHAGLWHIYSYSNLYDQNTHVLRETYLKS